LCHAGAAIPVDYCHQWLWVPAQGRDDIICNSHLSVKETLMTLHADFASQDYFRNPGAAIEKLRIMGPVVEVRFPIVGKVWTTTTQALADQVLKDTETFTIRREPAPMSGLITPRVLA
jgi:hypothetical protein